VAEGFQGQPAAHQAAFFQGFRTAGQYRNDCTGAYGAIIGGLESGTPRLKPRGKILSIGNMHGIIQVLWGLPGRVLGQGLYPTFLWRVFNESDSLARAEIRFHQANVAAIIYNPMAADWGRLIRQKDACGWTPRTAALYHRFASLHYRLDLLALGFTPPNHAAMCLYTVSGSRRAARGRMLYLPGIENWSWEMTEATRSGDFTRALAINDSMATLVPGVAWTDKLRLEVLARAGRAREERSLMARLAREDSGSLHPGIRVIWGGDTAERAGK
jgi:hypothetical protein